MTYQKISATIVIVISLEDKKTTTGHRRLIINN